MARGLEPGLIPGEMGVGEIPQQLPHLVQGLLPQPTQASTPTSSKPQETTASLSLSPTPSA